MRRPIRILAAAVAVSAFTGGVAAAHTPIVADNCNGLTVTLTNYEHAAGAALNNTVVVTIDGITQSFTFDGAFTRAFTWAPTSAHTWSVVIDANQIVGAAAQWDRTFTGDETACQTTTTISSTTSTSSPPDSTTTSSTTTVPPVIDTTVAASTVPPDSSSTTLTPSTVADPTTTPVVDQGTPPTFPPSTVAASLPATGSSTTPLITIVAALLAVGGAAVTVARRDR